MGQNEKSLAEGDFFFCAFFMLLPGRGKSKTVNGEVEREMRIVFKLKKINIINLK